MKSMLQIASVLLLAGCSGQTQSTYSDAADAAAGAHTNAYVVLTEVPDALLDEMSSKYSGNKSQQWREQWKRDNSDVPIDGQRTITLLEVACYADVTCHPVEYPLRVVTLDCFQEHRGVPGVRASLEWIRSSYRSNLPLDSPGDESGAFKGLLVESMNERMTDYAEQLLRPPRAPTSRE